MSNTQATPARTPTVNINGTPYALSDLSEAARTQVTNIQAVDAEINRLKLQLNIAQTARRVFIHALNAALPGADGKADQA